MTPLQRYCLTIMRPFGQAIRGSQPTAFRSVRPLTTATRPCPVRFPRPTSKPLSTRRHNGTSSASTVSTESSNQTEPPTRKPWRAAPHRRADEPVYELYFTCNSCKHRSGHSVSKQGYHNGTVLVRCPGCEVRHLISDHLKIFSDKRVTIEDLMREKGQTVRVGGVDGEGDVEFWDKDAVDTAEQQARTGVNQTTQSQP